MNRKSQVYVGKFRKFLRDFIDRAAVDDISGLGAQMSYYFILSFFPFLIFLIALLSYTNITSEDFITSLSDYLPPDIFEIVLGSIKDTVSSTNKAILSVGAFSAIWVASNAIEVLLKGINRAYDWKETRPFWKIKLLAIFFTIALSLVYVFSLITIVFGGLIAKKLNLFFELSEYLLNVWHFVRYSVPIITLFVVFLIIYYYMPSTKISLKKIVPGAIFSTLAWMSISHLFSIYISNFGSVAEAYGSLGGIIILLIWIYWCGLAIMLGAEINATLYYFRKKKKDKH